MTAKRIIRTIHLWLGLISGLIVSIVCLTGAVWALYLHGWIGGESPQIPDRNLSLLLRPSALAALAKDSLDGRLPSYITYAKGAPAWLGVFGRGGRTVVMIDPWSGKVLKRTGFGMNSADGRPFDFWLFIRRGHQSLWLPRAVGRPLVNYGTLAFVIVLLSGIVLWIPKTKRVARQRLWFKWKKGTGIKRKIFDFHAVAGIYAAVFLLLTGLTGMVWGLEWYAKSLYRAVGGGSMPVSGTERSEPAAHLPVIDPMAATDSVFEIMLRRYPDAASFYINCPDTANAASVVRIAVYPEKGVYYNRDVYAFDRYSLKELVPAGIYGGRYADADFPARLFRSVYDLHTGAFWGMPGKILYIIAALLGASLPLTGVCMVWYRRKRMRKKVLNSKIR